MNARIRYPLFSALVLVAACASTPPADGGGDEDDAAVGVAPPPPPEAMDSRLLYFHMGQDAWLASAAGTESQKICEKASAQPDEDGSRVLCVPDRDALEEGEDPVLKLYDLGSFSVTAEYEGWIGNEYDLPHISPEGSKVAFVAFNDNGLQVVRVFDDGAHEIDEVLASGVIGWAGEEALVLDRGNQAVLWVLGSEDEGRTINGSGAVPVSGFPAGVAYERLGRTNLKVYFLDVNGQERDFGIGRIGGVGAGRLLIGPEFDNGPELEARLVDLADTQFEKTIPIPSVGFDRMAGVRLVGANTVLVELQMFATCGIELGRFAMHTIWHHIDDDGDRDEYEIGNTEDAEHPHIALTDRKGDRALIVDVDPCGEPIGTARIVEISDHEVRDITDFIAEPVRGGDISPDGRFVVVSLANGVQVVDLATDTVRIAGTGQAGGRVFHFR